MTFNESGASFNLLLSKYLKWISCPQQHCYPLRPESIISVLELCTASACLQVPCLVSAFRSQIKLRSLLWWFSSIRSCLSLIILKYGTFFVSFVAHITTLKYVHMHLFLTIHFLPPLQHCKFHGDRNYTNSFHLYISGI